MIIRFTDQAKEDKKLQGDLFSMVETLKKEGLPKTREGLETMYRLYNTIYGQNKKLNNCIYCRKSVADYLGKAVLLLEVEPQKATKPQRKKTPAKKKTTRSKKK